MLEQHQRGQTLNPRSLFGRPSDAEMEAFWVENQQRFAELATTQFRSQWNFDPEVGEPLPGDFEWSKVA